MSSRSSRVPKLETPMCLRVPSFCIATISRHASCRSATLGPIECSMYLVRGRARGRGRGRVRVRARVRVRVREGVCLLAALGHDVGHVHA